MAAGHHVTGICGGSDRPPPRLHVIKTISVPPSPQEALIRPDGKVAHVSCSESHQVTAIQISNWSVRLIEAGPGADSGVDEVSRTSKRPTSQAAELLYRFLN